MTIKLNGKANSSHNHNASQITSGTLPVTRGGTGVTSLEELKNVLGISSGNVRVIYGYINFPSNSGLELSRTVTFSQPFSNTPLVSVLPTEPPENGYVQLFLSSVSATKMTILNRGAEIDRVYYSAIGI